MLFNSYYSENDSSGESRQGISTDDVIVAFNGINDSKYVGVDNKSSGNSRQGIATGDTFNSVIDNKCI